MFSLEIFPVGGLASSVITTVWIGVLVVAFLNLRFGTTLSGLVVPGYLVPLFILKPVSAWIIIVESIFTFSLAWLLAERLLVRAGLGELFGRDRFFILILMSILVRIFSDYYFLPQLEEVLVGYGLKYEFSSQLHSFGLIIIALCANQFWNSGLKSGGVTLFLYIGLTYFIIAQLLIPFTNFNISTLGYMYEDVASSILASPKSYIILVSAAYIASRLNLHYGWDFNGILIPALLALQWYVPEKILYTFIEAVIILITGRLLLRLSIFKNMNIEGAREIVFFFTIGFVYKFTLSYFLIYYSPEQKITDYFGFGYLLSTLIAIKMYQKGIAVRFTKTTIQTSLIAALIANVIGFSLTFISNPTLLKSEPTPVNINYATMSLQQFINRQQSTVYSRTFEKQTSSDLIALEQFRGLFEFIEKHLNRVEVHLNDIQALARSAGYSATIIEEQYLVIFEKESVRGYGLFIFNLHATNEILLSLPKAVEESQASLILATLIDHIQPMFIAITNTRHDRSLDGSDNVLLNSQTPFNLFHQLFYRGATLQIRQLERQNQFVHSSSKLSQSDETKGELYLKKAIPDGLSLAHLKNLLGDYAISWDEGPGQNRQRDYAHGAFAEMYLSRENVVQLLASNVSEKPNKYAPSVVYREGALKELKLSEKTTIANKDSQAYVLPSSSQLLYFDHYMVQPMLQMVKEYSSTDRQNWLNNAISMTQNLNQSIEQFGYTLTIFYDTISEADYFVLQENLAETGEAPRYWGSYIIRLGLANQYQLQVPAPKAERGTTGLGKYLFQGSNARALLIAGTNPKANNDGTSLLTLEQNTYSLFNLMHQSLVRYFYDETPLVIQVRGHTAEVNHKDIRLSYFEHNKNNQLRGKFESYLHSQAGLPIEKGQFSGNAQSQFINFYPNTQFAELSLAANAREAFRSIEYDDYIVRVLRGLSIVVKPIEGFDALTNRKWDLMTTAEIDLISQTFDHFFQQKEPTRVYQSLIRSSKYRVEAFVEQSTQQLFVALVNPVNNQLLMVYNGSAFKETVLDLQSVSGGDVRTAIEQFLVRKEKLIYWSRT